MAPPVVDQRALPGAGPPCAAPEVSVEDQVARALDRVGSMLNDRWRLDSLLGVGGMAAVYAATHRNGNRVAIKILHPELSGYAELRERFLEEGYAANKVAHPGVVAVHDDGVSDEGSAFLVMELLEGETLQARRQRESFVRDARDLLWVADRILDVLEAAHEKGIVHRDIKPENVFLTEDGRLRLLDFGIARDAHSRRTQRTRAGSAMGTPAFMPPEQARGHAELIDGRTDLWALGATLFWMATGRFVRCAETPNEELLQAMTQPAPPVLGVAPDVPACLARLIDTALAFDKSDRFESASAMRAAVAEARAELDALPPLDPSLQQAAVLLLADAETDSVRWKTTTTHRPVTSSHATPAAAPMRRRRWRLPAVLAFGAAIGAAVAWFPLSRAVVASPPIAPDPAALSVVARPAAASPAQPTPPPPAGDAPPQSDDQVESSPAAPPVVERATRRVTEPRRAWRPAAKRIPAPAPPGSSAAPASAPRGDSPGDRARDPLSRRK